MNFIKMESKIQSFIIFKETADIISVRLTISPQIFLMTFLYVLSLVSGTPSSGQE